ncbi:hypothetical protein FXO38_17005 [Capsicum annuum]|nr:hypothetical protein FXO38_17005 [Capsicum annuum]KAF3684220.1 hypothetical protein FXO37_01464 [Capsicum annuum]
MDKLLIAIFFLFFTFSLARTPLTQEENDIPHIKLPESHPESDATSTNQFDKEIQHVQENQDHLPEPKGKKIKALPLTLVRLRPINRHFRVRPKRPSRLCNHHHFRHAHNLKPGTQSAQLDDLIPHGTDMILSSGENSYFDHVMFHDGMHRVPEEWMSFLYNNDEDDDEQKMSNFIINRNNHNKFGRMKLKERFYDPLDDEEDEDEHAKISEMQQEDQHSFDKKEMKKQLLKRHHEEEEREAEEGNGALREGKKTGGFMKHIRKFLDNYFD